MDEALVTVRDLWVEFSARRAAIAAVRGVSFELGREKLGIVGESGSGKTLTARALMRLVPRPGRVRAARLSFAGTDLLAASDREVRRLRGRRIAMVLQDPKFSLNPVMRVGTQMAEAYRIHHRTTGREAAGKAAAALRAVRIEDAERVMRTHPHEVSGGMAQRIMIAMMLISNPDLLIADEPTSALDIASQHQVLSILDEQVTERRMGLILISHDLDLVASFCDRILVMRSGQIVEMCKADRLADATHPYTRGLLDCRPRLDRPPGKPLPVLPREPGTVPWGQWHA